MAETANNPQTQRPANGIGFRLVFVLVLILITVGFGFYIPLLNVFASKRPEAFLYFLQTILPCAAGHFVLMLILHALLGFRARGTIAFWLASTLAILCLGGWPQLKALALLLLLALVFVALGGRISRSILEEESGGWAVSLGLGILCVSLAASYLAWTHWLKWWVIAPLLLLPFWKEARRVHAASLAEAWKGFSLRWNLALALSLESLFLLIVFAYVYTVAPDVQSDALRSYWPYTKLMRRYSGFVEMPQVWAFIIPQAGLAYSSAVMTLFRERVVQLSSFLVWLTLIGLVCRRKHDSPVEAKLSIALIVASCPVVLWVSTSLMQDCFVCLVVVIFAIICLEGKDPGSWRFWAAIGCCAGLAWASKFSTALYAIPCVIGALVRSVKARGFLRSASGLLIAGVASLLTMIPWLVNSYRQSGNPVFPLFLKYFPAPLWPRGVGFSNLDNFRLPPGPRGWFLWLVDLTYRTSRFVEGADGKLGLTLLVIFPLALLVLWKGNPLARAVVVCSLIGTAGLISMTAYVRYWLAGLWLVALASPPVMAAVLRSPRSRFFLSASAAVILSAHAFMTVLGHWADDSGWPWKHYSGKVSSREYLGRTFPGLEMLDFLQRSWRHWPKVWYTNYEGIGHFNTAPVEAAIWELRLHKWEPRECIRYLSSAGCEYWIVNYEEEDTNWFRVAGIAPFFWGDRLLVASQGPIRVYRMRPAEEVMREFDERAKPGTDLLVDGGFEDSSSGRARHWATSNIAQLVQNASEAESGIGCFRLGPGGSIRQEIALPPGIRAVELEIAERGSLSGRTMPVRWTIAFRGYEMKPSPSEPEGTQNPEAEIFTIQKQFHVESEWRRFRGDRVAVPPLALSMVLYIENDDPANDVFIDNLHLYSRP